MDAVSLHNVNASAPAMRDHGPQASLKKAVGQDGHKSDGRSVYDDAAKAELVALCMQPGASVSRLARECGVNANQVGRWLRERGQVPRS